MKYQCKVEINASLNRVCELYLDLTWQLENGLAKKEIIKGNPWEDGSVAHLYFIVGDKELIMKETIEKNDLPHSLTAIYELDDVWNRCESRFYEKNGRVIYTMDSEFRFGEEMDIPKVKFVNKTQQELELFKTFVEKKNTI